MNQINHISYPLQPYLYNLETFPQELFKQYVDKLLDKYNRTYQCKYTCHLEKLINYIKNSSSSNDNIQNYVTDFSSVDLYKLVKWNDTYITLLKYSKLHNHTLYSNLKLIRQKIDKIKANDSEIIIAILSNDCDKLHSLKRKVFLNNPIIIALIFAKQPEFIKRIAQIFNMEYVYIRPDNFVDTMVVNNDITLHTFYLYAALYADKNYLDNYATNLYTYCHIPLTDAFVKEYFSVKPITFKHFSPMLFYHIEKMLFTKDFDIKPYLSKCEYPIEIANLYFKKYENMLQNNNTNTNQLDVKKAMSMLYIIIVLVGSILYGAYSLLLNTTTLF